MNFVVEVTRPALEDAARLDAWLTERGPRAAARLGRLLEKTLAALATHPLRGRQVDDNLREINVPFGRSAYIVRYDIVGQHVLIIRIWHSLEER
jgi:plasmid stabilization system protein ParE